MKGNLNEAKALLNRRLAIQEKFYGPEHVAFAISLQFRASFEAADGHFREAIEGTELVILSACDTGSGEVKIGEGVMSLRRAFRMAGAESVLASHWKVSDKATSQSMAEFMRRWRAGEQRAKACAKRSCRCCTRKNFSAPVSGQLSRSQGSGGRLRAPDSPEAESVRIEQA